MKDGKEQVPVSAGHPSSGLLIPETVRFSDDRAGLEARFVIVGHSEKLADMVRNHEPVQKIREQLAILNDVVTMAAHREIVRIIETANGKAN